MKILKYCLAFILSYIFVFLGIIILCMIVFPILVLILTWNIENVKYIFNTFNIDQIKIISALSIFIGLCIINGFFDLVESKNNKLKAYYNQLIIDKKLKKIRKEKLKRLNRLWE
jgi:hypothetical protein